jgi:predicted metalloendopeptidase
MDASPGTGPGTRRQIRSFRQVSGLLLSGVITALCLTACTQQGAAPASSAAAAAPTSGIDRKYMDASVRPQDDIFQYANGTWLKTAEIPDDHATSGAFNDLDDRAQENLRGLIEAAAQKAAAGTAAAGTDERKIGDLYAAFMDEAAVEAAGLGRLKDELARIDGLTSKSQLPALFAHLDRLGVDYPYGIGVGLDARDSTKYAVGVDQSGLGLPDRDYYIKSEDKRLAGIKAQYQQHIARMLGLGGLSEAQAGAGAKAIVDLETKIAKASWTKVELRDPVKTYNKTPLDKLDGLTPGFARTEYLNDTGIKGKVDYVIVGEPGYFKAFAGLVKDTPLDTWKVYLKWQLLHSFAPYLNKAFVDENFAFAGTALLGQPEQRPRWKRGVGLVERSIGEGLGQLYVARYFPPAMKAHMQALVGNLIDAYRADIQTLDWMGPQTKQQALEKLSLLMVKIGYPDKWRDYSKLNVVRGDLIGNIVAVRDFAYGYQLSKLGKPVDRTEWEMTPQTVNAYYDPTMNEIVFPAAILQPPFFDPAADDAANYGGIGVVIGHEISHGFDDQGSQFDAHGNLRDWWTAEDHKKFGAKTSALVAQYDAFEALPGYKVNGQLTLGENIADNSGLAISYKAWQLSLGGKPSPVIDGFTGDQRFFLGMSQIWRGKVRENAAIQRIKSDPHSPPAARGTLPLQNHPAFFDAFGIKEGDRMYRAPGDRVQIW